ncbi:MAG: hypothetical protein EBU07_16720, partial [Betaproteobacteria bacterium]|nr:hypothetical protein [Betaproteobacteria bacterium]
MPAHEPNPAREARVGFITLSIVLGVTTLLIVLCNIQWTSRTRFRLAFRVSQDVTGVQPGTPVTLGGITWGKVLSVDAGQIPAQGSATAAMSGPRAASRGTLVTFEIDARINLFENAKIARSASMLGGDVQLVILETGLEHSVEQRGVPTMTRTALSEGSVLIASSPNSGAVALLGSRLAAQANMLPDQLGDLRKAFEQRILPDVKARGEPLQADFLAARDMLARDREAWRSPIDQAAQSIKQLQARLAADSGVVQDIERGWERARPVYDALVGDMTALKRRIDDDVEPRATRLWEQATTEWDRVQKLSATIDRAGRGAYAWWGEFMADNSLMGGQISRSFDDLLGTLLKALVGKPGEDGMARLHRYEAASR